jgi:tetratricopeptide (TPR) repeat protein
MKKLTLALFAILLTAGATFAQVDKLMLEANRKALTEAKKKADEAVMKKDSLKSKTWLTRGEAYLDFANSRDTVLTKTDPTAAYKAMAYFKKAVSMDAASPAKKYLMMVMDKDGKPEVEGQKMYAAFMDAGITKYQAKDFPGALKDLQTAMVVAPKDTTAAMYTGVIGQMAKNDAAAQVGYEKFLELGGKDPGMIYALAQIYKNENKEEQAIAAINKGIALHPNNKDLKAEKINMLLSFKKIDAAIKELEVSVNGGSKNVQEVVNLAILYENKANELEPEIRGYKDQLSKGNVDGLDKKIQAQKDKISAYDDEVKRLTDKIKKDPKSAATSKKQIGEVNVMKTEANEALTLLNAEHVQQAASAINTVDIAKKSDEAKAKQNEARGQALKYYKQAIELDPNNYDVNFNLGVMSFNEAVVIKKEVDAMDMNTYKTKGKVIEDLANEKFKSALPYFEKAWSIKKEDDLKSSLRSLYQVLKMEDKLKALGE